MAHAIFPPPQKSVFLSRWKSDHKKNRVAASSCWRLTSIALVALGLSLGSFSHPSPAIATGESWDSVEAATASAWISVAYGDGVWVAVAEDGAVMRSTNGGASWTAVSTGAASGAWSSVATDGNGVWVAVASGGTNRVMRSTDGGASWAAVATSEAQSSSWQSVAYGNNVWVAVASSGTNRVVRSADGGVSWTAVSSGVTAIDWSSVATDGNGVWVAVASGGNAERVMRSADGGVSWTAVGSGVPLSQDHKWISVAHGNNVWVAVASDSNSGNRFINSDDGVSWRNDSVPERNSWQSVAYGNGVWVAVASNRVLRSTDDARKWALVAVPEVNSWQSVAYGDGVWVAVASSGTNRVMRSLDTPAPSSPSEESTGAAGIYLHVAGSAGRAVVGTPVSHGSVGIAPRSSFTLNVQSMDARSVKKMVLATGITNGRGHLDGQIRLGALAPGSYKIVMTGSHPLGYPLVLTNHIVVDAAGKFVSVSPESLQPTLR